MDKKRKVYAPFSLTSEAGVAQTPVEGYIDVNQTIYPTVNTGTINENGTWAGVKSDDVEFLGLTKAEQIGNGGVVLFPDTAEFPSINMNGFRTLQLAMKVSNEGNYDISGRFGPDTIRYGNLSPIAAGQSIRIIDANTTSDESVFDDTVNLNVADAWFVFTILQNRCIGQLNMQVRVANGSGGLSDIEFGFRRLV